MLVDPDGRIWIDSNDMEMALRLLKGRIMQLQFWAKIQALNENDDIYKMIIEADVGEKIGLLEQGISAVKMLDKDKKHYYRFEKTDGNFSRVRLGTDNVVYIQGSDFGFQLHEIIHIQQSLNNEGLKFSGNNFLVNAQAPDNGYRFKESREAIDTYRRMTAMEVEAYRVQYAYNNYFPISPITLNDITPTKIGRIIDQNGTPVYKFALLSNE